jgi:hypothetical protein
MHNPARGVAAAAATVAVAVRAQRTLAPRPPVLLLQPPVLAAAAAVEPAVQPQHVWDQQDTQRRPAAPLQRSIHGSLCIVRLHISNAAHSAATGARVLCGSSKCVGSAVASVA